MLQGVLPGSLKIPDQAFVKLERKRDRLLKLYTSHFNRFLSEDVINNKLNSDPSFLNEVYRLGNGHVGSFALSQTNYVKRKIKDFTREAKQQDLISKVIGRGYTGLTVLVKEGAHQVLVKLPTTPSTNFARAGHVSLQKEFDHVENIASIEGIDHSLMSQPVDRLSIRGKLLAHGLKEGKVYLGKEPIHARQLGVIRKFSESKTYSPQRVAELIKALAEIYKKQSILSYGDPPNIMVTEGAKALSMIDLCPVPCTDEHDRMQLELQKRVFADNAVAAALYLAISHGALSFLSDGEIASNCRHLIIEATADNGKDFFNYREGLIRDALQTLLDLEYLDRDELLQNLESLRDMNSRLTAGDVQYLNFKCHGQITQEGMDMCQRLIENFRTGLQNDS